MNKEDISKKDCCDDCCYKGCNRSVVNAGDGFYALGIIGALIYFISTATSFWIGALGVLKAIVWPIFVVYELLKFFHL